MRHRSSLPLPLLHAAAAILALGTAAAEHPRLFFGPADVPALRRKVSGEPFRGMATRLKADLELDQFGQGPAKDDQAYDLVTVAFRYAQRYVLTGEDRHARRAREVVERFIEGKFPGVPWASPKLKGLTSDMVGSRVAFCYDLCHGAPSWDAGFSATVSKKLTADGGGSAVMEISNSNLGVTGHQRRFLADHAQDTGAAAAYLVCDTSANGAFWQFCTIEPNRIETDGNTFTVTAGNGASLKATVLHPASVSFTTGTRPRGSDFAGISNNRFVHCANPDGDYLVVMTVVPKGTSHPQVQAKGTWDGESPDGLVKVGKRIYAIQGDKIAPR